VILLPVTIMITKIDINEKKMVLLAIKKLKLNAKMTTIIKIYLPMKTT